MKNMRKRGLAMLEYVLLVGAVLVVAGLVVTVLIPAISTKVNNAANQISQ